jgi:hypothetical protein
VITAFLFYTIISVPAVSMIGRWIAMQFSNGWPALRSSGKTGELRPSGFLAGGPLLPFSAVSDLDAHPSP